MYPYIIFFMLFNRLVAGAELAPVLALHDTRAVQSLGGWSLSVTRNAACPAQASQSCGSNYCCPSSLNCLKTGTDIASACCSGTTDCTATLLKKPACADDSWSLWNTTISSNGEMGFFCCLPGQDGLSDGSCVPKASVVGLPVSSVAWELSTGSSSSAVQSASVSQHAPTLTATIVVSTGVGNATSTSTSTGTGTSATASAVKSGAILGVKAGMISSMEMMMMIILGVLLL